MASPSSPPPLVPPLRFSLVEEGVYRGAYPSQLNLRFLTRLGLRSMVSLLATQYTQYGFQRPIPAQVRDKLLIDIPKIRAALMDA